MIPDAQHRANVAKLAGVELPADVRADANGPPADALVRKLLAEPPPLYDFEQMLAQPSLEWLIDELLPVGSFATLTGKWGTGKSFLALAWALAIGTNRDWLRREVKGGGALYVAAEHCRPERLQAYALRWNVPSLPAVWWRRRELALKGPEEVDAILDQIVELPVCPKLIVLDTYAKCTVGLKENEASDTAIAVENITHLMRETGAAVLALHHPPHGDPDRGRGSTALDAAADTNLLLKKRDGGLVLSVTKQRDGAEADPLHLRLVPSGPSVVVELDQPGGPEALAGSQAEALKALTEIMVPGGVTMKDWEDAAHPLPRRTLMFARKKLVEAERVKKAGSRYLLGASATEVQS